MITGRRSSRNVQKGKNKNNNREINFPIAPKQIKFATLLYLLNKHPYLNTLHEYQ